MSHRLFVVDTDVLRRFRERLARELERALTAEIREAIRPQVLASKYVSTLAVDTSTVNELQLRYDELLRDYERVSGKRARVVKLEVVEDFDTVPAHVRWPNGAPT